MGRAEQAATIIQVLSDLGALRQDVERFLRLQRLRDVQTTTHFVEKGVGVPGGAAPEGTFYWDTLNDNLYVNDAGINTWTLVGGIAAPPHAILSATHTDSIPQAVTSGSLIYGDATPDWNELVHPGAANRVLQSAAAVVGWSANAVTFPAAGAVPVGTGAANHAAYWSNVNTLTNEAQLALSRGGTGADLSATGGVGQYVQQAGAGAAFTVGAILAGDVPTLGGMPALTYGVANAAGVAATYVRTDATLAVFDVVVPGTIQCDDAAGAGIAGVAARRDHQHAIVCAIAIDIANANAEGVAASFSRSDHAHNHPAALGANLHHDEVHVVNSTGPHAEGGLTIGHVLRVSGAAAFSFAAIQAGDIPGLGGVPNLTLGVVNAAGAAATYVQTDASVAVFDAVVPGTIQCDDAAATGAVAHAARRDHQHAIVCAAPIANLSVSSTNQEGAEHTFARSDHSHAVTTSSNPGAAVSILASDASGYLQLAGLGIGVAASAADRITMVDGGTIGQPAGPLVTFDDTLNYLEIMGCDVSIGTTTPDRLFHVEVPDAVTSAITQAARLSHITSGTAAAGFGVGLEFELEENGGVNRVAGMVEVSWHVVGANDYTQMLFSTALDGVRQLRGVLVGNDNVTLAGNARGEAATDFGAGRSNAALVASGLGSTIGGGYDNLADGIYTTVGGGSTNNASGDYSTVGGGNTNAAGGDDSVVGGGSNNQAREEKSSVLGGYVNIAWNYGSTIGGGARNDTRADYSTIPGGYYADADKYGQVVHASGRFAADGDAQGTIQMVIRRAVSTHAVDTGYALYLDGGAGPERMTIGANTSWTVHCLVNGITQNAAQQWGYEIIGLIERDNAGNTTLAGQTLRVIFESDANYTAELRADDGNEALYVRVSRTGGVDYDIRWTATIRTSETTYP